jgi:putative flippase GtrA
MLKQSANEFVRYFLVQVAAYAVEWAAYLAARHFNVDILPANVAAKVTALCFAFFSHRAFTFRTHQGHVLWQAVRYLAGFAFNTTISTFLLWVFHTQLQLPEVGAKILADTLIVAASFVIAKKLIFRTAKPAANPDSEPAPAPRT